ncbi:MAG TPA: hypothetical protein VFD66_03395 [Verrucomicrobiae bacterium]|nr:hypothetical protein [Verrucomicrobiae bacterium]
MQEKPEDLTAFYRDWAEAEFGADTAAAAGALFARLDGKLPRSVEWVDGPGGLRPDTHPWNQTSKAYAFVDEFAALEKSVRGSGNRERFQYWLNTFRYMRATAELRCAWGSYNAVLDQTVVVIPDS